MELTPTLLDSLYYNTSLIWQGAFNAAENWCEPLITRVGSSGRKNVYGWTAVMGRMREWRGARVVTNLAARAAELENRKFEKTVGLKVDDLADNNMGLFSSAVAGLGQMGKFLADDLVLEVLQGNATCYDGQAFFHASHPVNVDSSAAGTFSNYESTGKTLTADNYNAMRARMMAYLGEDGKAMRINPNLIIVPPSLERTALEIVEATALARVFGSDTAAAPVENVLRGKSKVMVIADLEVAPTTWYLADTTQIIKPIVYQERQAPDFVALTSSTDPNVFERDELLWGSKARAAAMFTLPQLMAKFVA